MAYSKEENSYWAGEVSRTIWNYDFDCRSVKLGVG